MAIWRHRNDKLWKILDCVPEVVIRLALDFLFDWILASRISIGVQRSLVVPKGYKKGIVLLKTSSSVMLMQRSLRMRSVLDLVLYFVIMLDRWFLQRQLMVVLGCARVWLAEAIGLAEALSWIHEMRYKQMIFEADAKLVVDVVPSTRLDKSEFGSHIHACRNLLQVEQGFSLQFVR
ncbi:hypothetical protein PTKIN_Ptkin08bG0177300 [Pterospermum kingtungense]